MDRKAINQKCNQHYQEVRAELKRISDLIEDHMSIDDPTQRGWSTVAELAEISKQLKDIFPKEDS